VASKLLVVMAVAVVATASAPGSTARDSSPFPSGWIVLPVSPRRGIENAELFRIRADGTGLHQLTHTLSNQSDPSFAPNGKRLVFTRGRIGLFTIGLDGRGLRRLTTGVSDEHPVYSPNGRRIAFVRNDRLFVMRADGSGARLLRRSPPYPGRPSWSPDGRSIVLSAGQDPAEAFVYVLDARTGRVVRRLLLIDGDLTVEGRFNGALLAPNGRTVVFNTRRPPPPNCQGTECEVFALNRRPLGGDISSTRVVCNDCGAAAWSSDNRVLLITRLTGQLELRVVRDGRTKVVDLHGNMLGGVPTLQPR
jgi:Tol biopolymer transport system component